MIKTNGLTTDVEFGVLSRANIAVSSTGNILTLQMLAAEKKVGEALQPDEIKELPKINMLFRTPESIDVVVKHLNAIKKGFGPTHYLPLAC